ncbi:hypothetical protein [Bacillus thuringiensis]|uniref:hypothetical protein n=1 Tax=Bacillus thuringiensis TaxID=1428 RepID=UPI0029CAC036|nr:hypothetical protein [Bacillus thuringiensis]
MRYWDRGIFMGNIQVRPEELRRIAKNFKYASNISSEYNFFLNHEDISSVLHLGFINETELEFQKVFKKEIEEKQ